MKNEPSLNEEQARQIVAHLDERRLEGGTFKVFESFLVSLVVGFLTTVLSAYTCYRNFYVTHHASWQKPSTLGENWREFQGVYATCLFCGAISFGLTWFLLSKERRKGMGNLETVGQIVFVSVAAFVTAIV